MTLLTDQPLLRRLITIGGLYLALIVVTVLFPVLVLIALSVDLIHKMMAGTPFIAVRIFLFGWIYMVGEAWGLAVFFVTAPLSGARSLNATYRLQDAWAAWNFRAMRTLFSLEFRTTGEDDITPGPIILLSRHASLIDTLLPSWFVARTKKMRLRYVLKKELLLDPAIDLAGNRLPNHFVDRSTGEAEADLQALRSLARDLSANEGILIFPEGTRYSEEKRKRYARRFDNQTGEVASIATTLRRVLPPRPGGTLALLEGSDADVVVLAHRGLEGFARVRDMWKGGIVGSRIDLDFRRISRADIPTNRSDRVRWLFEVWQEIDSWVVGEEPVPGTT